MSDSERCILHAVILFPLQVYLGVWKDQEVAVKLARQAPISLKNERQFQSNIAKLHSLNHPNIVPFLGACCWKVRITVCLAWCFRFKLSDVSFSGDLQIKPTEGQVRYVYSSREILLKAA